MRASRVGARRCIGTLDPPTTFSVERTGRCCSHRQRPFRLADFRGRSVSFDATAIASAVGLLLCEVERRVGSFRGLSAGSRWLLLGLSHTRDAYFPVMATGRMWAEYLPGESGGRVGARRPMGWAGTLALLFVVGGLLRLPIDAIAGVVS